MTEIAIRMSSVACHCQGQNRLVGTLCADCMGRARVHRIVYCIVQPLPIVSLTRWSRFKRRVGFEHPIELQEWTRDMEHGFAQLEAKYEDAARKLWGDDIKVVLVGEPAKGKTYGAKGP